MQRKYRVEGWRGITKTKAKGRASGIITDEKLERYGTWPWEKCGFEGEEGAERQWRGDKHFRSSAKRGVQVRKGNTNDGIMERRRN